MKRPLRTHIFECNAWVWLNRLSLRKGSNVTLENVPDEEWSRLRALGFDAVWLMGVWERSPAAHEESMLAAYHDSYSKTLPGWTGADVPGSPYSVHAYAVDARLGGRDGLAAARTAMSNHGLRLFLDFVPNHVAPDHPLVERSPELFIHDAGRIASGRDPHSAPWPDTVQLNAFSTRLRTIAANTILAIAAQCDGIRCDMAMLLLNDVFQRTWGDRAGSRPETEYWTDVLAPLRTKYPDCFVFAEAYWDTEPDLLRLGFDACYDKTLYDRLVSGDVLGIRTHLGASTDYQDRLVRFLENHDERRAAMLGSEREKAAAVVLFSVPGHRLVFDGQMEGARQFLPIRLGRAPVEPIQQELASFYARLLPLAYREGSWTLCAVSGWPDNQSYTRVLSWLWRNKQEIYWIVVNYAGTPSQAIVHPPADVLPQQALHLRDVLAGIDYLRNGEESSRNGMFISLSPWGYHFFRVERV